MKKSLFFVALFLSGAASAQQTPNASPNGAGASADNPDQLICRTQRETGSMLSRTRVCKTRAQWEADRREARQNIDRSQATRTLNGN